ncbi:MAG: tetratricopeptide repeat protein [Saprospiraceae bacterium]
MNKMQWIVLGSAVVLFLILYFGCDTKPATQKALEKTRALKVESTDLSELLLTAKPGLDASQAATVAALEEALETANSDSSRAEVLKQLSGAWYQLGQPAIAGTYAQQVAEVLNDEQSWSITGTTFSICLQMTTDEAVRNYCMGRAVQAFENAISISPDNVAHRVNLALTYTEMPPKDEPMKGILMLRELNQQQPNNVLILNSLARLAIKTGQFDRAKERLEEAVAIEPQNVNTICMLAQVYEQLGDAAKAKSFADQCAAANTQ